jgi:hypothetical protein
MGGGSQHQDEGGNQDHHQVAWCRLAWRHHGGFWPNHVVAEAANKANDVAWTSEVRPIREAHIASLAEPLPAVWSEPVRSSPLDAGAA